MEIAARGAGQEARQPVVHEADGSDLIRMVPLRLGKPRVAIVELLALLVPLLQLKSLFALEALNLLVIGSPALAAQRLADFVQRSISPYCLASWIRARRV